MKTIIAISAAAAVLAFLAPTTSQAGDRYYSSHGYSHHGGHGYSHGCATPRPVYYAPRPVYCAPRPVYCAPRPVYCAPRRPVYYAPRYTRSCGPRIGFSISFGGGGYRW